MLVSAEHERRGIKHDASSVWVEDVTRTSFKICIRELQNFDGAHQSIHAVSDFQLFILVNVTTASLSLMLFNNKDTLPATYDNVAL